MNWIINILRSLASSSSTLSVGGLYMPKKHANYKADLKDSPNISILK